MTKPATTPLVDGFGRVHRDLRISITDRCNLRCTYCMPAEGLEWLPREEVLSFEEITRLARILVERYGFDSIRLTGGEPTVRADLPKLIAQLADLGVDLAMTTNAVVLERLAPKLVEAGLGRINISLDTLRADRFEQITRRDSFDKVMAGIDAALAAGLDPVKINAVMMRGVNDDELIDFARFGRKQGVIVRFIEFMPLDATGEWTEEQVVTQAEIVDRINEVFPLEAVVRGSAPATRFRYVDGQGEIGVIASVTQSFCSTCDRVRLTSEGQLRSCLFAHTDTDLRGPLRAGATDDELAALIEQTVGDKWAGHHIGEAVFIRPNRSMSQIGG